MPLGYEPLGVNSFYDNALLRKGALRPDEPYGGDTSGQVPALQQQPGGTPSAAPLSQAAGMAGGGSWNSEQLGPFGIAPPAAGAATARWSSWAPPQGPPIADKIKQALQGLKPLSQNPQLPQHPLGAYTDSQYEADNAVLEQQINAAYQDVLSAAGYDSPQGHIAGSIEMDAARKERDLNTGLMNAVNQVTGEMQQAGTIFSGYHATQRAQAEQPFVTQLGDLAIDTPTALTRAYQQAEDLMRQYSVGQMQLIQQAAARRAAALAAQQAAAGAGGTSTGGTDTGAGTTDYTPADIYNPLPDFTGGIGESGYVPYVDTGLPDNAPRPGSGNYYTYASSVPLYPGYVVHHNQYGYYAAPG